MRHHHPSRIAALLPALVLLGGCGDPRGRAPASEAELAAEPTSSRDLEPIRYLSVFAFTGTVTPSTQLYVELLNEASPTEVRRDYRGWVAPGGAGWSRILGLADTVPVPRAAWRILPGPGVRVLVGDDSEIVALALADSTRRLSLLPATSIAEWTGPTGQRELFALAAVQTDSVSEPGLLYFRRAARPATAPKDRGGDRLLLIGDTRGNGLFIAQTFADTAAPAFAWGWMEQTRSRWTDVVLRPRPDGAGVLQPGASAWTLALPLAGIEGELWSISTIHGARPPNRAEAEPRVATQGGDPHTRLEPLIHLVEGSLETRDGRRRVHGLLLQGPLP